MQNVRLIAFISLIFLLSCTNGNINAFNISKNNQQQPTTYPINFNTYVTYAHSNLGIYATFADFNNDGYADFAIPNGGTLTYRYNLGNGSFSGTAGVATSGGNGRGIVAQDFNGDGYVDIISAAYTPAISIDRFWNNAGASFGVVTGFGTTYGPMDVVAGDFNQDGNVDLATSRYSNNDICVMQNIGGGSFAACTVFPTQNGPTQMVAKDVNSDGDPDLIVADVTAYRVGVLIGGTGLTFNPEVVYNTAPNSAKSVRVGDIDSDGKLDIVISTSTGGLVQWLKGNGDGTFQPVATLLTPPASNNSMDIADFNGDGYLDIVVIPSTGIVVNVYEGYGNGTFNSTPLVFGIAACTASQNVYTKDLNNDGRMDIINICSAANGFNVLLHN